MPRDRVNDPSWKLRELSGSIFNAAFFLDSVLTKVPAHMKGDLLDAQHEAYALYRKLQPFVDALRNERVAPALRMLQGGAS